MQFILQICNFVPVSVQCMLIFRTRQ